MPDLFALEHICAYCREFTFQINNPEGPGQSYCSHFKAWFPDQMNLERTPVGMRGGKCKHWKHMGERDENK